MVLKLCACSLLVVITTITFISAIFYILIMLNSFIAS